MEIPLPWGNAPFEAPVLEARRWSIATVPMPTDGGPELGEVRASLRMSGWPEGPLHRRVDLFVSGMALVPAMQVSGDPEPADTVVGWTVTLALDFRTGRVEGAPVIAMETRASGSEVLAERKLPTFSLAEINATVPRACLDKVKAWEEAMPDYVTVAYARAVRAQWDDIELRGGPVAERPADDVRLGPGERLLVLRALNADPDRIARLERRNAELVEALEGLVGNIGPFMANYADEADDEGAASLPVGDGQYISMYTFGDLRRAIALLPKDD